MNKTIIVKEGVENFRENRKIIKNGGLKRIPTVKQLLNSKGPKYHGPESFGCIFVKKRKEVQLQIDIHGVVHGKHYLNIYTCLKCGQDKECLHSGWEIGWWNGTESKKLT